jgi:hypothetical protein
MAAGGAALPLLLALAAGELFSRGLGPVETGVRSAAELRAEACSPCHAAAHAEWAASRHGLAWTNAIFQREYRQQRLEWCVHCHAPLAEQLRQVRGWPPRASPAPPATCAAAGWSPRASAPARRTTPRCATTSAARRSAAGATSSTSR